jgi:hypothetical protein
MHGDVVEHVVEKTDSRFDIGGSAAVQVKGELDVGFFGYAFERYESSHVVYVILPSPQPSPKGRERSRATFLLK